MDDNRWSIVDDGRTLLDEETRTAVDLTGWHPDALASLEPLLNPLPTMTGREIVAALRDRKVVEAWDPADDEPWCEVDENPDYWARLPEWLNVVARVVDPEPEPAEPHGETQCSYVDHCSEPPHDPSECEECPPFECSACPASVSADPLPEGVHEAGAYLNGLWLLPGYQMPEGYEYRKGDRWAVPHQLAQQASVWSDDTCTEVRPVSVPDTEQVEWWVALRDGRSLRTAGGGEVAALETRIVDGRRWVGRFQVAWAEADIESGMVTVLREDQS